MVVKVKETSLMSDKIKKLKGIEAEEKSALNSPEAELLKYCTKMSAAKDGKIVNLLDNKGKVLGTLNREDDMHCNLDLANGHRIVGRYQSSKVEEKPTWSVYDSNKDKTSKVRISDENRARILKGLFNDMRNVSEMALKSGQNKVCFRNKNIAGNSHNM